MIKRFPIYIPAMLAVSMTAPAFAQSGPMAPTPATGQAVAGKKAVDPRLDDQVIVCKRQDATGTRLGATKECHTRAEWAARSADAHEQTNRMVNTPQVR